MDRQNIIKDSSVTATAAVMGAVLSGVQGIVVAGFLGPASYGILQIYRLVLNYQKFVSLGTFWAMVREMSFFRGQGDSDAVNDVKNNTFTLNMITSALASIAVIVILSLWKPHGGIFWEALLVGLLGVATFIFNFSRHYFVATRQFTVRSILMMLVPVCNILFVLLFVFPFGLKGVLLAYVLAFAVCIAFAFWKGRLRLHLVLTKRTVLSLVRTGVPISGNGLLALLVVSVDRLMILYFLPVVQLGYYGIAIMARKFMENFYRSVFLTIFPRLTEQYGKTNDFQAIKNYIWKPLLVSAHLSPLVLGAMMIVVSPMVEYILPKYTPGIIAAQVMIASSFFVCLQIGIINFFITINRVYQTYPLRMAAVTFSAVTMWIATSKGWGIEGVAVCFLLSSAFLAGLLLRGFLGYYSISFSSRVNHFALLYYPFVYMCLGVWVTRLVSIDYAHTLLADTFSALLRLVLFFISSIPLLVVIQSKTGILSDMRKAVANFLQTKLQRNRSVPLQRDGAP